MRFVLCIDYNILSIIKTIADRSPIRFFMSIFLTSLNKSDICVGSLFQWLMQATARQAILSVVRLTTDAELYRGDVDELEAAHASALPPTDNSRPSNDHNSPPGTAPSDRTSSEVMPQALRIASAWKCNPRHLIPQG